MSRVKRGISSHAKHKRLLAKVKGFRGSKSKLIKVAHEAALHAGQYAYHGRKLHKRNTRREWILRIGEATKKEGISYSKFQFGLKKMGSQLDRKILSEIIIKDPVTFSQIVAKVKELVFTFPK